MRQQEATSIIPVPPAALERRLAEVESWPTFMNGVESVERVGHERYLFRLADGRDRRQVRVCVRHQWPRHRFEWRSLEGPQYRGCLELRAVDERHTSVRLSLSAHPASLLAALAEMAMPRMDCASQDLQNLERELVGAARR